MADEPKEQTWDVQNRGLRDSIQWLTEALNAAQQENEALKAKLQDAQAPLQKQVYSLNRKIEGLEALNRELSQLIVKERRETLREKERMESNYRVVCEALTAEKEKVTKLAKQVIALRMEKAILKQGAPKARRRASYKSYKHEVYAPIIRQYDLD